ncbi:MAG: helix-turn-helix domain-containing protein [Opitutaceae bacterium]|nr:helix-turn-helix domain-containing protein [Opitutaceae bacterium]
MQTIGERLEEARKRRGISIREAAEITKIRGDFLDSFEANNFDINLPDIYVRGFLRTYANCLKINADKIMTDFTATLLAEKGDSRRDSRGEFFGRMELSEETEESSEQPTTEDSKVASAPLQTEKQQRRPISEFISKEKLIHLLTPTNIKLGAIALGGVLIFVAIIWVIQSIISSGTPSTATDLPSTVVAATSDQITLVALGSVRVKVVQKEDKIILFSGTLAEGESKSILRNGAVSITYSIGKNLNVEKEGQLFRMPTTDIGITTLP